MKTLNYKDLPIKIPFNCPECEREIFVTDIPEYYSDTHKPIYCVFSCQAHTVSHCRYGEIKFKCLMPRDKFDPLHDKILAWLCKNYRIEA